MGEDHAGRGDLVPVAAEVGEAQVVGDVLVPVIGLGDKQVGIRGGLDDRVGPRGVTGVGDGPAGQL